jgi:hypothetical protein
MRIERSPNGFDVFTNEGKLVKTYKYETDAKNFVAKNKSTQTSSFTMKFSINKRFDFLDALTKMVIDNKTYSLIITGNGGLGKSYSVMQNIKKANLKEDEYLFIKGFSTAKMLYRTLYENNGKLIIFDDCDSVLKDKIALNILKAALDSYSVRTISWNAEFSVNDSLPNSFEFTGRVIFISNLSYDDLDQAIKSRSMNVDLHMSPEDKIERMEHILKDVLPDFPYEVKRDALDLIKQYVNCIKDLNIRTLEKVTRICGSSQSGDSWKELALYMITK